MSSSYAKYLSTTRLVTFSTTILFSFLVMCISANLISLTEPSYYFTFTGLALSTSLLSLLSVTAMLVVDFLRQGSIFSYIVVEIGWLSILWVLWLSSGSYAAWTDGQLSAAFPSESNCDFGLFGASGAEQSCHEIKAIAAFSFLTWILLMTYTIALLVLAIRAQERGNPSWTTGVRDGTLFYSSRKTTGGAAQVQAAPATIPYSEPLPQQPLPQQPYPSSYPTVQV